MCSQRTAHRFRSAQGEPMSEPSLLPPSASDFMRCVERGATRLSALPVSLNQLWDPDTCPVALLPYLAWALSVDRWDRDWTEETKRQVIRDAWVIHRHKGTISAIRRVVEPFGYVINVTEWWETRILFQSSKKYSCKSGMIFFWNAIFNCLNAASSSPASSAFFTGIKNACPSVCSRS